MKKIILPIIVCATVFVACKKDRTCTCTTSSDVPNSTSYTTTELVGHAKKNEARRVSGCYSTVSEYTTSAGTYHTTRECDLK
jgi:hypothetical protein